MLGTGGMAPLRLSVTEIHSSVTVYTQLALLQKLSSELQTHPFWSGEERDGWEQIAISIVRKSCSSCTPHFKIRPNSRYAS